MTRTRDGAEVAGQRLATGLPRTSSTTARTRATPGFLCTVPRASSRGEGRASPRARPARRRAATRPLGVVAEACLRTGEVASRPPGGEVRARPRGGACAARMRGAMGVTEPPNYDGPHVPVIVIITSDSRTYVPHNLKGLLSSEQDPITGVLQYYNSLFKISSEQSSGSLTIT
jgi:hypothetical protein